MKENLFEKIKKINEYGVEYWSSRDLAEVLEYSDYRRFLNIVDKAKKACENAGWVIHNHFVHMDEMVEIGSKAKRLIDTIHLTRHACNLIVQNGDSTKIIVAKGQTYFSIQTLRQEKTDTLAEDYSRVHLREEMKEHNKNLTETASVAGVVDYPNFQNSGYKGLYGGMTMQDIHNKKKLGEKQKILDHMNSEELAANLFRATQTEAKIRRDNIQGQSAASLAHFEVGQKVRNTIVSLGGTMPEDIPVADSISESKKRIKASKKKTNKNIKKLES